MNLTNKILEVTNLYKSYYSPKSETLTINDISFDLFEGDFLGIIGPSGCGKSSILNILSGLDKNYQGNIIIKDNINIGYMFQDDALFDHLTIYDNAILGLKISKTLNDDNKKYVEHLLKKYGLYDFRNKHPYELSGGMKQRLALIRTLATKPDILLLDEPFSALDYQTRLKVSNDVYNILKEEKKTMIIVTHDINEAISMCSKIIVLSKRPATIKNIHIIDFSNDSSPIEKRNNIDFSKYFELIWKEINNDI